jgi:excisionase family DNA binding protein
MEKKPEVKSLVSLKQLSKDLEVSYRHLHRAVKDGKIRTIRLGGLVRVPRSEVDRILSKGF